MTAKRYVIAIDDPNMTDATFDLAAGFADLYLHEQRTPRQKLDAFTRLSRSQRLAAERTRKIDEQRIAAARLPRPGRMLSPERQRWLDHANSGKSSATTPSEMARAVVVAFQLNATTDTQRVRQFLSRHWTAKAARNKK